MNAEPENAAGQFDWIPQQWFAGTSDQRCRFCLKPVLYPPACLSIDVCTCGYIPTETNSPIRVKSAARNRGFNKTSAGTTARQNTCTK